jgi:ribosomal protein S18 acetylase RimI-like enzyme
VHYLRQLINTPACGVLLPAASVAARASDGTLCGAVLTTSIGPRAAHIAQLVVDPDHARQGLGRRLVDAACAVAASEGRRYMTLLVAEDNTAARASATHSSGRHRVRGGVRTVSFGG